MCVWNCSAIDGDVPALALTRAIAADPVTDAFEAAETLDVEMDHLARPLAFIADYGQPGFEQVQAIETQSPQHHPSCGNGPG